MFTVACNDLYSNMSDILYFGYLLLTDDSNSLQQLCLHYGDD